MDKKTYIALTAIFLFWSFAILLVKNTNPPPHHYITPEDESWIITR